jgi:hypothetical protein
MNTYNSGDQVALAVDYTAARQWSAGHLGTAGLSLPAKFPPRPVAEPLSDLFYRNAIASGSIVPPHGESAAVRRTDYLVGLCVICLVACGLVGFCVAYFWRA